MNFLRKATQNGALAYMGPALLAVVLAVFTAFQLNWLNSMRDTDQDLMLRSVNQAAEAFRNEFDREIANLFTHFQVATTSLDSAESRLKTCYDTYSEHVNHNNLLDRIFFVSLVSDHLELREYLPWEGSMVACSWPAGMRTLEESFQRLAASPRMSEPEPLLPRSATLVIPTHDNSESNRAWVLVTLNQNYMLSHLVPDLARSHLLRGTQEAFKLGLIARDQPDQLLYRSDSDLKPVDLEHYDLSVSMYSLNRYIQASRLPTQPRSLDSDGYWKLLIRHREGSLLAAANRVRNQRAAMVVSASTLVILFFLIPVYLFHRSKCALAQQLAFFSGLSHDLRAPLSVISSAAFNLSRGIVTEKVRIREYGALMRSESSRLQDMVNHVMEHARSQSQENTYFLEEQDLAALVRQVVNEHGGILQKNQFELSMSLEANLPKVPVDTRALKSAIGNLITNAVKYASEGQWLGIRLYQENAMVVIAVSDHGKGISPAEQVRIFEPYYRAVDARSSSIEGSGLGLNMVKTIVKRHGGKVHLHSKAGETTFTLSLPTMESIKQRTAEGGILAWKKRFS